MTLYTSLFLSHINYGLLLWGIDIAKAFLLQKKMIRIITGSKCFEVFVCFYIK